MSADELDELAAAALDVEAAVERRNAAARRALAAGHSLRAVATFAGVHHQTVANWAASD